MNMLLVLDKTQNAQRTIALRLLKLFTLPLLVHVLGRQAEVKTLATNSKQGKPQFVVLSPSLLFKFPEAEGDFLGHLPAFISPKLA